MLDGWIRATKAKPCPVCGRPTDSHQSKWCMFSSDGGVAICPFTESNRTTKGGQYLHIVDASKSGRSVRHSSEQPIPKSINWNAIQKVYVAGLNGQLSIQAKALGVSEESLQSIGVGYDGAALTFPMRKANGGIVGIRRRFPSGEKKSVQGGREGIFIPAKLAESVIVVEGPTDLAALLTIGICAIGRPNCLGGIHEIVELAKRIRITAILVDNDGPGERGGKSLAKQVGVKVVHPPEGIKDARAWVIAGATSGDVLNACKR